MTRLADRAQSGDRFRVYFKRSSDARRPDFGLAEVRFFIEKRRTRSFTGEFGVSSQQLKMTVASAG